MSNIVKSNFTSLNGLNNENIDNLSSDTILSNIISTNKLYVDGALVVPNATIGQQCTVNSGTAITLPSSSAPTVTNTGTDKPLVFTVAIVGNDAPIRKFIELFACGLSKYVVP